MKQLAATFDMEYKEIKLLIETYNKFRDDWVDYKIAYNSDFDDVRGSALVMMDFIGWLAWQDIDSLNSIEVLK